MEEQKNQTITISQEKEYNVYVFDAYWVSTVKSVLELCEDNETILGAYGSKSSEPMFDKDIRFYVMCPAEKYSSYRDIVEQIDWQDVDSYTITPKVGHFTRTEIIKADLKRMLEISDELDKIVEKYA